ncbi:antioxidant AhpC [Flavobacterium psychrophilum]|uniref:thioredoxin-dependent peroxiredoxin n=3 Tax=Flavobacterium psychrophilum TaxID=96345 RepID=A6GXI2_FLAPJ|nr:peroxiredoxin-like family protein [Flavobacterium psychrophilum]AIG29599.1 antioxidant AhpC [Flavobacterium psychrophilum]AIG31876.1 antioxidant AhpC [Flavobacterium psychrophilum]AIG34030.1 antioxidant AhpC [Flavobacterium psychrophilum]AIG36394.1 antioxidant AhpC [Flavobacterium psychrophilum]AIG38659.1 antioxidant AhpC [Flavobacterium psychrophilum]
MKKLIYLVVSFFSLAISAQTDLPKLETEISPLLIGQKIPSSILQTIDGKAVKFEDFTKSKKTILVVYRGGWCPYCNLHLSALAEAEEKLIEMGYQIIAVSPDSPESLRETITKDKLNYTLLSDNKGSFIKALRIAYAIPEGLKNKLKTVLHGVKNDFLPVPSLFIISDKNEIEFEYISPDYKTRISNELLLAVATALKK